MKILFFTDAHDEPGNDQSRFTALGNLIVEEQPDVIIQAGDFTSMSALSHWDKDKRRAMEMRRYKGDIESANSAIQKLFAPLAKMQKQDKANKKKQYRPMMYWFEGNHEGWLEGYLDRNPTFEGMVNLRDDFVFSPAKFKRIEYVPWKTEDDLGIRVVAGLAFTHVPRGRTGPISSKYICDRAISDISNCPIVFGHTHRRGDSSAAKANRNGELEVIRGYMGGCFFEGSPSYAIGHSNDYWRGVIMIDILGNEAKTDEDWTPRPISMKRLKTEYL